MDMTESMVLEEIASATRRRARTPKEMMAGVKPEDFKKKLAELAGAAEAAVGRFEKPEKRLLTEEPPIEFLDASKGAMAHAGEPGSIEAIKRLQTRRFFDLDVATGKKVEISDVTAIDREPRPGHITAVYNALKGDTTLHNTGE